MVDLNSIGERIKRYREVRGWTQDRLAEELHVSRQAVSKWEVGASLPDVDCLVRLAKLFTTTVDEILTGTTDDRVAEKPEATSDQGDDGNDYVHDYTYDYDPDDPENEQREDRGHAEFDLDVDVVIKFAPIISGNALDAMLESVPIEQFEFWHIHSLGPFAGRQVLSEIVRNMPARKMDDGELVSLRAFVDEDVIIEYAMRSSIA